MAGNSFLLKGWTVTIAAALFALAAKDSNRRFAVLALFPSLAFWGLDAYYLRQERLFRRLYDELRKLSDENYEKSGPFAMSTKKHSHQVAGWFKTLWTPSVVALHGVVIGAVFFVIAVGRRRMRIVPHGETEVPRDALARHLELVFARAEQLHDRKRKIGKAVRVSLAPLGKEGIERMINGNLKNTSVTVVLIGEHTAERPWVRYEIKQSIAQNNGLLGIYIHHLKNQNGESGFAFLLPTKPSVPSGVEFPAYNWDRDLDRFRKAIEEAGKRSDALRKAY